VLIRVDQNRDGGLAVRGSDTGCEVSSEHFPRIFDRPYRVDGARSQHPDGAGLGLAIVKSIMALHGGSGEVHSEVGKGTNFTLIFPAVSIQS
jgi:signal transduction histidine kinase